MISSKFLPIISHPRNPQNVFPAVCERCGYQARNNFDVVRLTIDAEYTDYCRACAMQIIHTLDSTLRGT